jgi:hypothetical protein
VDGPLDRGGTVTVKRRLTQPWQAPPTALALGWLNFNKTLRVHQALVLGRRHPGKLQHPTDMYTRDVDGHADGMQQMLYATDCGT